MLQVHYVYQRRHIFFTDHQICAKNGTIAIFETFSLSNKTGFKSTTISIIFLNYKNMLNITQSNAKLDNVAKFNSSNYIDLINFIYDMAN